MLNENSRVFGILLPSVSIMPLSVITQLELLSNGENGLIDNVVISSSVYSI